MAVNGVVIREGQTWITGGGERVVIHKIGDNTSAFPVIASHCTTTLDGRAWLHCPTANDLVRLADEHETLIAEDAVEQVDINGQGLQVGQNVFHKKFGQGAVLEMEETTEGTVARVEFIYYGVKRIALSVGRLFRLPDDTEQTTDADNLAAETLLGIGWVFNGQAWVQDRPDAYDSLASVLDRALLQASQGKGKERHATGDTRFEDQPMGVINRQIGSIDGYIYQAHKKSLEALRLPAGRDVAELLGSINYLAGAVIALESWAKKSN